MDRTRASARRVAIAAAMALLLAACSSSEEDPYQEEPVDTLYNSAMTELLDSNYVAAAKQFEEVERQHPYSIWAAKAQVMSAYAYFRRDRYDEAINAADRFIQLHPTSPDAPYAYYLKSLAYYEQIVDVGRDQRTTGKALDALEEITRRFPQSQYARDASLKLDLTRDHLAGKEMAVGRFYLKRGELVAAINRFKSVVERHQTTSQVPEALLRLSEAYTALGLDNEAKRMAAILGHNYPGSAWYADAYELVEGVELADFPRPTDDRLFYQRWLDPDSTIAKAEREEVPELAPGARSIRAEQVAAGVVPAPAPGGESRARVGDEPVLVTPAAQTTTTIASDGRGKGFFGRLASAVGLGSDDDPTPAPVETAAVPEPPPTRGEERSVDLKPIALNQPAPTEATPTEATPVAPDDAATPEAAAAETAETSDDDGVIGAISSTFGSIFSSDDDPAERVEAPPAETVSEAPTETAARPTTPAPKAEPAPERPLVEARPEPRAEGRSSRRAAAPSGPRPWQLPPAQRSALVAEAESQTLAATEAAGEWRRAKAAAVSPDGRRRAEANVVLSEAAAEYWDARGSVVRANTDEEVRQAELRLAQESVGYWAAARGAAEDDLARSHADGALAQAQEVLDYWRRTGRRPSWLERTFGTSI